MLHSSSPFTITGSVSRLQSIRSPCHMRFRACGSGPPSSSPHLRGSSWNGREARHLEDGSTSCLPWVSPFYFPSSVRLSTLPPTVTEPPEPSRRSVRPFGPRLPSHRSRSVLVVLPPRRFHSVTGTRHFAAWCRTWGSLRSDPRGRETGEPALGPSWTFTAVRCPSKVFSSPTAVPHHCGRLPS